MDNYPPFLRKNLYPVFIITFFSYNKRGSVSLDLSIDWCYTKFCLWVHIFFPWFPDINISVVTRNHGKNYMDFSILYAITIAGGSLAAFSVTRFVRYLLLNSILFLFPLAVYPESAYWFLKASTHLPYLFCGFGQAMRIRSSSSKKAGLSPAFYHVRLP